MDTKEFRSSPFVPKKITPDGFAQDRNEVDAFTGGIHGQKLPPDIYPEYDGKLGLPEAVEEDPTSSNPLHLLASSGEGFDRPYRGFCSRKKPLYRISDLDGNAFL